MTPSKPFFACDFSLCASLFLWACITYTSHGRLKLQVFTFFTFAFFSFPIMLTLRMGHRIWTGCSLKNVNKNFFEMERFPHQIQSHKNVCEWSLQCLCWVQRRKGRQKEKWTAVYCSPQHFDIFLSCDLNRMTQNEGKKRGKWKDCVPTGRGFCAHSSSGSFVSHCFCRICHRFHMLPM